MRSMYFLGCTQLQHPHLLKTPVAVNLLDITHNRERERERERNQAGQDIEQEKQEWEGKMGWRGRSSTIPLDSLSVSEGRKTCTEWTGTRISCIFIISRTPACLSTLVRHRLLVSRLFSSLNVYGLQWHLPPGWVLVATGSLVSRAIYNIPVASGAKQAELLRSDGTPSASRVIVYYSALFHIRRSDLRVYYLMQEREASKDWQRGDNVS